MSDELSVALRDDPPASVAALPDEVRDRLAEQVLVARSRQAELVEEAEARAVAGVPLPFRGIIRKALGG